MPVQSFDAIGFLCRKGLIPSGLDLRVEPLAGGYWNQVLRLRGRGLDWVLKRFHAGPGPIRFPNLPAAEAEALRVLSPTGAVPRFVAYFPDEADRQPVLVYEYAVGRVWQDDTAAVARALRLVHGVALPADTRPFRRLGHRADEMLAETLRLLDEVPEVAATPRAQALRRVLPAVRPLPQPAALSVIHTDAGPGNLIESGDGRVVVIDWQCAGTGDPAEDLYAFLSPAFQILFQRGPLAPDEAAGFLAAYGDAAAEQRLAVLRPFYAARMLAYCAQRAVTLAGEDPIAALRYGRAFDSEFGEVFPA